MRFFQLGLIVVIVLAAMFVFTRTVMAQSPSSNSTPPADSAAPVEASAIDAVGLLITATVGVDSSTCSITNTVQVRAGTTVYYCFTLRNTGVSGDESLTFHHLQSSRGANRDVQPITLAPGEVKNTVQLGFGASFTDSTSVDLTNFFTWTARPPDNEPQLNAVSRARIDVVAPSVSVIKTVGQDPNNCPSARFTRIPSGTTADFCITIHNTGDVTLTSHTLTDSPLSINSTFKAVIPPGGSLSIMQSNLQSLGISNGSLERKDVQSVFPNSATYNGGTASNLQVSGSSTATVDIGSTTVLLTKRLNTIPEDCTGSSSVTVPPGTRLYYCVTIQNTGSVTITHHHLEEPYLSIRLDFDYNLPPGATLNVTNNFLASIGQPVVFGPFEISPQFETNGNKVVGNLMTYVGTAPGGFIIPTNTSASVTYPPPPTITPTDRPHSPPTPIPPIPVTPSPTPIPPSATPSPTSTDTPVTPSPTPTRSYGISLLETPTPRTQVAGVPIDQQQQPQDPNQLPTVDPNLQGQQPPVLDPIIATATQLAVDATTTAVVAEATAAEVAIESAQATALAETQATLPTPVVPAPDSPLPISPLPADGSSGGLPVAPGFETPTETPTALPTETLPPENGTENNTENGAQTGALIEAPGADVTVLPGPVTVEVATVTPVVMVLVVTNTPESGAPTVIVAGQRPIDYPTPTATPDFVMAAARTFDVAVETMGWLWFLVGSLIFFVTAGIVAGLFFRQSEANRYELPEPDYWLEEDPMADHAGNGSQSRQSADDEWPADLP